jgi:predicted nucleotidyltransferase
MSEARPDSRGSSASSDREVKWVKRRLREALPRLRKEYAVDRLYLQVLGGEAGLEGDLDALVDFEDSKAGRQVSLLDFISLKQELEDFLGMEVDLGERKALRGSAGRKVHQEADSI